MTPEPETVPPAEKAPACPLCGGEKSAVTGQLSGGELRALWKANKYEFTPEAWGKIRENFLAEKWQCAACGFTFFDPSLAGNEAFYRQLERAGYFSSERPEFARTLQFAQKKFLRRILDVGCGSGSFLDLAKKAGCDASGLELNRAAAEKARAKGHKIFDRLLHELDRGEVGGNFDLITFFQVLEHVGDPVAVVKQAAAFLNSGGCISIAVPSEEGMYRLAPWDPSQWPPHHVSRWRLKDFEQLARAGGLRLVASGGDILLGAGWEQLWKQNNRLAAVLGKPVRWGGDALPAMLSFVYRKTGMKHFFPHWGSSIYAYLQKN
jgi:2-polyprenyl-3-methyl-5-hydroxy-6-metoxy-1,4-benzoquinol methylase